MHELTQPQLLLLALDRLERRNAGPQQIAALVVEAWQTNKGVFGLDGFEGLHPNSNRIVACLSHTGGPVKAGWMERPWPGCTVVALTAKGRAEVKLILGRQQQLRKGA